MLSLRSLAPRQLQLQTTRLVGSTVSRVASYSTDSEAPKQPSSEQTSSTSSASSPSFSAGSIDKIFNFSSSGAPSFKKLPFNADRNNTNSFMNSSEVSIQLMDPRHVPRTGPKAGRSVEVTSTMPIHFALRQLNSLNRQSEIKQTVRAQAVYEKPGKKAERLKIERKKRRFNQNVKRMFELVSEARRKGY